MMETETDNLRYAKLALGNGAGSILALGFGTLPPTPSQLKCNSSHAPVGDPTRDEVRVHAQRKVKSRPYGQMVRLSAFQSNMGKNINTEINPM